VGIVGIGEADMHVAEAAAGCLVVVVLGNLNSPAGTAAV
jgi:hypothetical protein